ncbi:hypothetical protein GCM10023155_03770 [Bremerella cremea]|uniref:hypothetical protein n=1 Tax=Bremerella cremea TaxID=1031537 RepID=UPI003370D809
MTSEAPSTQERAQHGSAANLSKSKVIPSSKSGSNVLGKKPAKTAAKPKQAVAAQRPKWSGEPEPQGPSGSESNKPSLLHGIAAGKESPILRSRRTISAVILPGDRHVPALEVPWGAPCNPPKDFLKEQAGHAPRPETPTRSVNDTLSLISPDEKEIRIEPTRPAADAPIVESEIVDMGLRSDSSRSSLGDADSLIAGVAEDEKTVDKSKPGFHRSAAEKVIAGKMTDEVVTEDNDGGFYRPTLPGQGEDITMADAKLLERAMAAAQRSLGRGPSFDEVEAVENSKYVSQVRMLLREESNFGASAKKKGAGIDFPVNQAVLMSAVGVVSGIGLLGLLIFAISTISSTLSAATGGTGSQYEYVTPTTSQFPVEARGPAGLVTVKFPSNFDAIPVIERPWLGTKVEGYRIIRPTESFVMMYSNSIPGTPPTGNQMPTEEQLEVFGLHSLSASNPHLTKTDQLSLDNYPLIEYHFSADVLRSRPGKSRMVFLFTQQRMFVFLWSGNRSTAEVSKFFQSISVKGIPFPGAG